jgi:hypothetical protein
MISCVFTKSSRLSHYQNFGAPDFSLLQLEKRDVRRFEGEQLNLRFDGDFGGDL